MNSKKKLEAAGGAPEPTATPAPVVAAPVVAAPAATLTPSKEEKGKKKSEEPVKKKSEEPKKEEAVAPKKEEGKGKKGKKEEEVVATPTKEEPKKEVPTPTKEEPKKEVATPTKEEGKKEGKKGKKEEGGAKKEEKKEEKKEATTGGYDAKLLAAVQKEGGKKGQDILGVFEMGGLEFFCCSVDTPEGDIKLVSICLESMNQEIDMNSEEKRGGAGPIGKMLFSAGVNRLAMVARVPSDKTGKINTAEWMKHVVDAIGGKTHGTATEEYAEGFVDADVAAGRYTIKMKDDAIAAAVGYLKDRGCFPDKDDDDSDDQCFGDDDFNDFPDS